MEMAYRLSVIQAQFHQLGPEQEGFLRFFEHELAPGWRHSAKHRARPVVLRC